MPETSQPRSFGDYVVDRELGRGGMGVVYAATHAQLGKRVAVKVLLADVSRDAESIERFKNEARAASAIEHPSIVEIHTVGHEGDAVYIVMELLQGESLAARLRARGALSIGDAIEVARQCANALDAAHRVGIVHRDLKPDNVYLVPDVEVATGERVKLLDFGIAKLLGDTTTASARTVTGAILGTPHYMSPEQCEGAREVDARSDLYSLGCMLFQMVTGRLPFISAGIGGLIGMHLHVAPPELRSIRPDVPDELDHLVARLLAKAAEDRIQTASDVAAALKSITPRSSSPSIAAIASIARPPLKLVERNMATMATVSPTVARRPKRWPWIAGGGVVIAAGVIGFAMMRSDDEVEHVAMAREVTVRPSPPVAPRPVDPVDPVERRTPLVPLTAEIDVIRGMIQENNIDGAEFQLKRALEKSPADQTLLALQLEAGKMKATLAIVDMRKAATKKQYLDVKKHLRRVREATTDRQLRASAEQLWSEIEPVAILAVKTQVLAAVEKLDCKAASTAAKQGRELGQNYDQLVAECNNQTRLKQDSAFHIKQLVDDINGGLPSEHIAIQCNSLIQKDRNQVPWARCVQAACGFNLVVADSIVSRAPPAMRAALEASCPQIRQKP